MSGVLTQAPPRPRPLFRISNAIGWVMLVSTLLLFAAGADNVVAHGYTSPMVANVWRTGAVPLAIGGEWLVALIIGLIKLVPKSGPEMLVIVSICLAATLLAFFARTLRRRNWSAREIALATILIALHPTTLYMATTGQPLLLTVGLTAFLVLAIDRAEALGDAQSLMGLGLAAALLFVTTPNAVYVVLPVMTVLPVALREMQSAAAAVSLFVLALVPTIVVVGGIMIASDTMGLKMGEVVQIWSAPLHGAIDQRALTDPWLARHGGKFALTLWDLAILCFACTPQLAVVILRMVVRRAERRRPATAILTLVLPALAGACAAVFWHISSPWTVLAVSSACSLAWAAATTLRRVERRLWVLLLLLGDLVAWFAPVLWQEADKLAWRAALL